LQASHSTCHHRPLHAEADGFEVIMELRQRQPSAKIIAISGHPTSQRMLPAAAGWAPGAPSPSRSPARNARTDQGSAGGAVNSPNLWHRHGSATVSVAPVGVSPTESNCGMVHYWRIRSAQRRSFG